MLCPYCNIEMQKGYIQCRDGLHWTPKKQKIAALAGLGKGAILIGNEGGVMPNTTATAFRCEKCKKIIIDYSRR